ncbi:hypothetical protein MPTK1_5g11000 [Marchantia polymorpha subsp. ruderalis]|uniref:Uncharacterized protein n=2 Tax=Marchantia polymorpha TaxID=3197 RepID=A0AAF6BH47_MARPO|nr:hypothetical protein MARPO_0093s0022 [Marchantia polymorpha]BBN11331.1 hypothetical protein Mp_5g11000 [Marchantia polymorpha subsp. ruderalis]|eukprot:PTQ32939.1 hypothetical protein MARPO_0093s0022 [Marchantia polymorpha]
MSSTVNANELPSRDLSVMVIKQGCCVPPLRVLFLAHKKESHILLIMYMSVGRWPFPLFAVTITKDDGT